MPRDYHYDSPRERDYSRDRHEGEGYRSERERERRRQRRESRGDTDDEERRRRRRERAARHATAAAAAAPGEHTPSSDREHYERAQQERQERRRRRGHRATDSTGEPILRQPERSYDSPYRTGGDGSPSPTKARQQRRPRRDSSGHRASGGGGGGGGWDTPASRDSGASARPLLHADALAQLDASNAKTGWKAHRYDEDYVKRVREQEKNLEKERQREERREKRRAKEEAAAAAAAEKEREKRRRHEEEMGFRRSRHVDAELEDDDEEEEVPRNYPSGNDGIRVRGYDEYPEPYTDDPYTDDAAEPRRRRREYTDDERDERRQRRKERALAATAIPGKQRKSRVVSGPLLEEGGKEDYEYRMAANRGGGGTKDEFYDEELKKKKRKKIFIGVGIVVLLLAIIIPVAVVVSGKKSSDSGSDSSSSTSSDSSKPDNSNLNSISEADIPDWAKGGLLDPFSWYDTEDFNVTFTNDTVGGLSIMGLNMTWDDSVQANEHVPALNKEFKYGEMSIRGVNVGGWFNLEPWITPSFFESYNTRDGVIDEWTLTTSMGSTKAKSNLEQHYSSWITKQTFADIRDAGFDHVRIPFNYWAVTTYDGDPYVPKVCWRYLLRGIEYARQQGLRVNLDLHGLPGSQNGWNHSGKQGVIGWLNGTDGDLNRQRSLDIHDQLSKFFAQPRYKNVVTMYGLANEPRMVELDTDDVLQWYDDVIPLVRNNNITAILVFGDGFMGLDNWQGKLQNYEDLLLDVHQYVIFNVDLIKFSHAEKVNFACKGWTQQSLRSMNKSTGFGPTMCGEWSQADTDCTQYINNVGWGTRWEGTYNTGDSDTSVLTPTCPTDNNPVCSCNNANADPSDYSDTYKQFLLHFALAQIYSFEQGWGWFYWTWKTEKAVQWSWESGMKAGILPDKVWDRSAFSCNTSDIPDYSGLGLAENY